VAELKNVASVQGQIVGPKNGTTSMGFSQDSLLGSYLMTSRDTFLTRSDFMNLIAKLNEHELKIGTLPMPAILKPEPLWTGKQLVSLLLPEQVDMKKIGHTPK
jgi:DNA-directed RNA polymerase II subunit RPB1